MKKVGRVLLWLLGAVLVLGGVLLLAVNLYVQSQGAHRRIQQELSQRLDTPLRLRRISVTPWNGLSLEGITIPQENLEVAGDFLQARSFQLRVEFLSLFREHLVIRQVALVDPKVLWLQNAAGKWRLPRLPITAPTATPPPLAISPGKSPRLTNSPPAGPNVARSAVPNEHNFVVPDVLTFTPEVRRVKLRDGDFTFFDQRGIIVARFSGLNFSSDLRTGAAVKGSAKIAKISLANRFFIENLDSSLHYDPASLGLSDISAQCARGRVSGNFEMQLQAADSPFLAKVKFRDVQAAKLLADAGGPSGIIDGRLEGSLEAHGKTNDARAIEGSGEVFLRDGKVQQYSLLVALGQILQIDELTHLQLEQAEMHFRIGAGVVIIDQLLLRSPNIRLSAVGTINFSGKMRLQAQLALDEKIRARLFAPIRENFQPVSDLPGYGALAFNISGTVERPKTNLMDKLVGRDWRNLGSMLNSFFGSRAKKTPLPTPAASPLHSPPAPSPVAAPNESTASGSPGANSPTP